MMLAADDEESAEISERPRPPNKLRARIMSSGYKYKMLSDDFGDGEEDGNYSCSRRPTALRKIIFFLGLVCIALLVALIVVAVHHNDDDDNNESSKVNGHDAEFIDGNIATLTSPDGKQICVTPKCAKASAYIVSIMNQSIDPCEDMYQYACGSWMQEVIPPPENAKYGMFSEVSDKTLAMIRKLIESEGTEFKGKNSSAIEKLKKYYATCMDEDKVEEIGTQRILELINKLGSWTVSNEGITEWNETTWTIQKSLVDMHLLARSSLFSFSVSKDDKDAAHTILYCKQSGLTLSHKDKYKEDALKDAFLAFSVRVGVLLGGDESHVTTKMTEVFEFEKQLAEIFVPKEELRNPLALYNKMTIGDLQKKMGSWIDVTRYLTDIFHGYDVTISSSDKIIVQTPTYFEKLKPLIEGTDKEVLANYMIWNLLQSITGYLPNAFSKAALELSKVETGVSTLAERWKRCLSKTEHAIGFATSALFVEENFPPESKEKVITILNHVKEQFILNLNSLSWLDTETRAKLKDKAEAMTQKVGYPDWILDPVKLDERYEKLQVEEGEMLSNKIYAVKYGTDRTLNKYGKPPDLEEWIEFPHAVNAFYEASGNYVILPAGILQPPFFALDFPEAYVYGAIGMIVGHEMTHGFDDHGRMYDKHGNLKDMWSSAAAEAFSKNAQCIKDQYSSYTVQGQHLNGVLTAGENIADNGGVKFGFNAYMSGPGTKSDKTMLPGLYVTDEQLFFLGFSQVWCTVFKPAYEKLAILTDVHSNTRFRVNGVVSNSDDFAKAYNCDSKAAMNPQKKCKVW